MLVRQFIIEGLGHISALIADDARHVAAVVDPRRDVDIYIDAATERGWRITHVFETHLHNDFVSGARELAALTGARHVIGAGAELTFDHIPAADSESFDIGALGITAISTPGHTPEHVAYAVADRSRAEEPLLIFTGGSLLVGAVGRTDLLGTDKAEPYARQQFHSLHDRLLTQADYVSVLPTHGGGSLCSKDIASTPSSTIGFERRHSPLLAIDEVEAFVRALLAEQPAYPRYFTRMRPINKGGPAPLGTIPGPRTMSIVEAEAVLSDGGLMVDLRRHEDFAMGHAPGALSIPAGSSFGTWLGWVVAHDQPLVLLLESIEQWDDALRQALRIGHESIHGCLVGIDAWRATGRPLEVSRRESIHALRSQIESSNPPLVLDVRQRDEYELAHVPGSIHLMAGDLPERLAELPRDRPIATICAAGYRSAIAAGLLLRAGFKDITSVEEGVPAWRAAGYPIERGSRA